MTAVIVNKALIITGSNIDQLISNGCDQLIPVHACIKTACAANIIGKCLCADINSDADYNAVNNVFFKIRDSFSQDTANLFIIDKNIIYPFYSRLFIGQLLYCFTHGNSCGSSNSDGVRQGCFRSDNEAEINSA